MNPQIQKLIKQATTIEEHGWGASYEHFDKEKFAELIVRECIGLTHWKDFDMCVEQRIRLSVAQDIKQHFGVEQ